MSEPGCMSACACKTLCMRLPDACACMSTAACAFMSTCASACACVSACACTSAAAYACMSACACTSATACTCMSALHAYPCVSACLSMRFCMPVHARVLDVRCVRLASSANTCGRVVHPMAAYVMRVGKLCLLGMRVTQAGMPYV
eukprot:358487-Chlamydomonas_euryale.AAC.4